MADTINFDARYRVDGRDGIAWRVVRYATKEEYEGDVIVCTDEECDHALSYMCWGDGDTSIVTDLDWVYAIMVGDDREQLIEVETLTEIADEDYCHECGAIGCTHDGRN